MDRASASKSKNPARKRVWEKRRKDRTFYHMVSPKNQCAFEILQFRCASPAYMEGKRPQETFRSTSKDDKPSLSKGHMLHLQ